MSGSCESSVHGNFSVELFKWILPPLPPSCFPNAFLHLFNRWVNPRPHHCSEISTGTSTLPDIPDFRNKHFAVDRHPVDHAPMIPVIARRFAHSSSPKKHLLSAQMACPIHSRDLSPTPRFRHEVEAICATGCRRGSHARFFCLRVRSIWGGASPGVRKPWPRLLDVAPTSPILGGPTLVTFVQGPSSHSFPLGCQWTVTCHQKKTSSSEFYERSSS